MRFGQVSFYKVPEKQGDVYLVTLYNIRFIKLYRRLKISFRYKNFSYSDYRPTKLKSTHILISVIQPLDILTAFGNVEKNRQIYVNISFIYHAVVVESEKKTRERKKRRKRVKEKEKEISNRLINKEKGKRRKVWKYKEAEEKRK